LELIDLFEAKREGEAERFTRDMAFLRNRQLLWHGSRTGNWGGILKTGLRIAPPEAPASGYLFGKGLYFANSIQKSAHYCWMHEQASDIGVCALLEVALGDPLECFTGFNSNAPAECAAARKGHTFAPGRFHPTIPNPPDLLGDGIIVPNGPMETRTGVGSLFDELICYNESQAKLRFVMTVRFTSALSSI